MDPLSDILKNVHLDGAVYINAEFTAPWCVQTSYGPQGVGERLAGADHVAHFHFLTEGSCRMRLADGAEVFDVTAGDLILFPHDDTHLLGSDLHLTPLQAASLLDPGSGTATELIQLRHGGRGAVTRFVCGYLACSRSACELLFSTLPRALRIPIGDGAASALLRQLLQAGVRESSASRPGSQSMLAKLAELIFVEAMRRYSESLPPQGKGWLMGLRDPQIGRCLAVLHGTPRKAWTVEAMAREVGLSRSALAARFTALVGEPPIQYLTRWRLALAAQDLRAGKDAIARVAQSSGYQSEAAFSRAFKREFGLPPAAWRRTGGKQAHATRVHQGVL
ncbi:MAG: AraC family transcriptional regulator [Ramlibacter sp.]